MPFPTPHKSIRDAARFADCRAGMAATEFALLFPVLLIILFGVVEGADALSASRRVSLAANTLVDLASQENELMEDSLDDLFKGVEQIVEADGAPLDVRLVSVVADDDGDPVVHWSRDNQGGEPYAPGSAYGGLPQADLLDLNGSMLAAEISYPYTSKLTQHFISSITFEKLAARWPRQSLRVQLCASKGDCTS